jgi:four helix bundle protein
VNRRTDLGDANTSRSIALLRSPVQLLSCSVSLIVAAIAFMFENLEVYQKLVDFADDIAATAEGFPRGYGFLVDQLNRAALSIATNLAEGNGRFTKPDRRHFFVIARGSVQECVPLLEIARRRGLVEAPAAVALKERLEIIAKMISGLINGLDKRA